MTKPPLNGIALLGAPGTGKTSVGWELATIIGADRLTFSEALKQELSRMLAYSEPGSVQHYYQEMTNPATKDAYRPLQQALGAFRRAQDEDYWVQQALAAMRPGRAYVSDDCRYWNEYHALKNLGFVFIRLLPGPTTRPLTGAQAEHESERDWPHFPVDAKVEFIEGPDRMANHIATVLRLVD